MDRTAGAQDPAPRVMRCARVDTTALPEGTTWGAALVPDQPPDDGFRITLQGRGRPLVSAGKVYRVGLVFEKVGEMKNSTSERKQARP